MTRESRLARLLARYRGRRGVFGRLVFELDVLWLRAYVRRVAVARRMLRRVR
jgi:hypothetical protein